jgi:lycopene cyclase domain-containing protein
VFPLEPLGRFTYLAMEAYIIGGVALVLWAFHFQFLWKRRWTILLGVLLVSTYALPLDAWAVARGWGGINPVFVSGIYFFGGSLLLEEIIFWLGTSFVTISAVLIFAELERRDVPC